MTQRLSSVLIICCLATAARADERPADVQSYLQAVHRQLASSWAEVQDLATRQFPATHSVNRAGLWAEVELGLDQGGRCVRLRLSHGSGEHIFDNSAMRVAASLRGEHPPLPAGQGEGRAVLFWRFHRDARGCGPAGARLVLHRFSPGELLVRALEGKDWSRARQVLQQHGDNPTLVGILGDAGLDSDDRRLRMRALEIATTGRIEAVLQASPDDALWSKGLKVLEQSRAADALIRLLQGEVQPPVAWRQVQRPVNAKRVLELVRTLGRLDAPLPGALATRMLTSSDRQLATEAIYLTSNPTALLVARKAWAADPGMTGVVAVRWRVLSNDPKAERAIRTALAGKGRGPTLLALKRFPMPGLTPDVSELVKSTRTPWRDRVLAIQTFARIPGHSLVPLYIALRADRPEVQIAALQVVGEATGNTRSVTFRVAEVAYKTGGPVGAAALAAQSRLGHEPFRADVLRLMRRLSTGDQAVVVASLWGYGEAAMPTLRALARHEDSRIRAAVVASLKHIDTDEARQLLAATQARRSTTQTPPEPAGGALMELIQLATNPTSRSQS